MPETTDNNDVPSALVRRIPRLGVVAWSFVGAVIAGIIVFTALSAMSEIILPLTFAAVLAVMFRPFVGTLVRHKFKPTAAAGLVVLGLVLLMVGVVTATFSGVVDQLDEIGQVADDAVDHAAEQTDSVGIEEEDLESAREAVEGSSEIVTGGALGEAVSSGIESMVAIAGGVILGSLIMYYMLKDGANIRRAVVESFDTSFRAEVDDFVGDACEILRSYGKGRTIMSAIVSAFIGLVSLLMGLPLVFTIVVVNFVGGYIPYVGAFLGGGLAVMVALGDGGVPQAAIMLVAVLASNLALENFVEPKVMGKTLDIHPLVILVVTALGGLLGGIVGLILAVPAWVIAGNAFSRLRNRGVVKKVTDAAQPAMQKILG